MHCRLRARGRLSPRPPALIPRTTLHPHSQRWRPSLGQVSSPGRCLVLVQAHLIRSGPPKTIFLFRSTDSGLQLYTKRRPQQRGTGQARGDGGEKVWVPRGAGMPPAWGVQPPHTGPTVPAAPYRGLGVVNECSPPSKRVVTRPLCSLANGGSQRTMHVAVTTPSQPRRPGPPRHSRASPAGQLLQDRNRTGAFGACSV